MHGSRQSSYGGGKMGWASRRALWSLEAPSNGVASPNLQRVPDPFEPDHPHSVMVRRVPHRRRAPALLDEADADIHLHVPPKSPRKRGSGNHLKRCEPHIPLSRGFRSRSEYALPPPKLSFYPSRRGRRSNPPAGIAFVGRLHYPLIAGDESGERSAADASEPGREGAAAVSSDRGRLRDALRAGRAPD
jgi:hypothetical protein